MANCERTNLAGLVRRRNQFNLSAFGRARGSLDYFVRSRQHVGRNREANLLGCFQIDDEFELGRLLHR